MRLGKGKRKTLTALIVVLAALLLFLFSVPLWLPWALKPLASRAGIHFSQYQRRGYGRFTVEGITFTNANVQFAAREGKFPTPPYFLWRQIAGPQKTAAPLIRLDDWSLSIVKGTEHPASSTPSSTYTNISTAMRTVGSALAWVSSGELSNGVVRAGNTRVLLPRVAWKGREVDAAFDLPDLKQSGAIHADLTGPAFKARIHSDTAGLLAEVQAITNSAGLNLETSGVWQTNQFRGAAHFGRSGTLPETATFKANNFRIPGSAIRMPDYQEVTGNVEGSWTNEEFALNGTTKWVPAITNTNFPAFSVELTARGNTNFAVIQKAIITAPSIRADVAPGTVLFFTAPYLREPATVKVQGHLESLPGINAHGAFAAETVLKPGNGKFPEAAIQLSATNAGIPDIEAKTLQLQGTVRWPMIDISSADVVIDDGSRAHAEGQFDWTNRTIAFGKATFKGPAAGRWLPAGYGYDDATANFTFSGPITNLSHQGSAVVTNLQIPRFEPFQVRLDWKGQDKNIQATAQLTAKDAIVKSAFSTAFEKHHAEIAFANLSWIEGKDQVFQLKNPARFIMEQGPGTNEWRIATKNFEGTGTAGDIRLAADIQWPQTGTFNVSLKNASSSVLEYLKKKPIEPVTIQRLNLAGGWTNGPAQFTLDAVANTTIPMPGKQTQGPHPPESNVSVEFAAHGDGSGVAITNLVIQSQASPIVVAHGSLPITIVPAETTNIFRIRGQGPANFFLQTQPNPAFWQNLSEWTGLVLQDPSINAEVSGTWESPLGNVRANVAAIQLPARGTNPPPNIERVQLDLRLDRNAATLTNFSFLVQGQPVTGSARLPLAPEFWTSLKPKTLNLAAASGHLRIADAQLGAFSEWYPSSLAPQGTLSLDASLLPGGKLDGHVRIEDARTRPLPAIGPIRDIGMTLRLAGHDATLSDAGFAIGGAEVTVTGRADLSGNQWLKGTLPPFELALRGTKVPLSRQPESIIRSDLNLHIKNTNGAPPMISGTIRLRDSFFLSNLQDLVPGGVASPRRRPPYFSVEEPLLADWRLAVRVNGENAIRIRTTLFTGVVSPNIRLQGTLKEPVALGDVQIANGMVRLPFANLDVQRGYISLTSDDPYEPRLLVTAASRNLGYDIRMEITGTAHQPIIQFTSTPPLSSEQLVMMVTAGELPRGVGSTLSPTQRAQTMAVFLGKDLLRRFGFGDQSQERLTFTSGREISETGRPTYSIEYKLTDRWSLEGEYDRFNALNAGLKWKIYSK